MPCICIVQGISYKTGMHTASSAYRVCMSLDIYLSIIVSGYLSIIQDHVRTRVSVHKGIWIVHRGIYRRVCPHVCRIVYVDTCMCGECMSVVCAWVSTHMHTGACLCGCMYVVTLAESMCKHIIYNILCKHIYIVCRCMHVYVYLWCMSRMCVSW